MSDSGQSDSTATLDRLAPDCPLPAPLLLGLFVLGYVVAWLLDGVPTRPRRASDSRHLTGDGGKKVRCFP